MALSGAQILVPSGVCLWYYSFPGAVANHPSFLLVPFQPSGFYTVLGLANQERSSWAALRSQSMRHMLFCSLLLTVGSCWSSSISSTLQAPGVAGQSAVFVLSRALASRHTMVCPLSGTETCHLGSLSKCHNVGLLVFPFTRRRQNKAILPAGPQEMAGWTEACDCQGFSCWRWQYCVPSSRFFLILFYFTFKLKLK